MAGKTYHNASNGRFVSANVAARRPATTVAVTSGSKSTGTPRSAKSGQFVTQGYADNHPSTTVNSK